VYPAPSLPSGVARQIAVAVAADASRFGIHRRHVQGSPSILLDSGTVFNGKMLPNRKTTNSRRALSGFSVMTLAAVLLTSGCSNSTNAAELVDTNVETTTDDVTPTATSPGTNVEAGAFFATLDQSNDGIMPGTGMEPGHTLFRAVINGDTVTTTPVLCEGIMPALDLDGTLNADHTTLTWPDDDTAIPFSVREDGHAFALATNLDEANEIFIESTQPEGAALLEEFRSNCRDFYGDSWNDPTIGNPTAGTVENGSFIWVGTDGVDLLTINGNSAKYQTFVCSGLVDGTTVNGTFNADRSHISFTDFDPSMFAVSASGDVVALDFAWMYRLGSLGAGNALGPWMESCVASEGNTWAIPEPLLGRTQDH